MRDEEQAQAGLDHLLHGLARALSQDEHDDAVESVCELGRRLFGASCAFYVPTEETPDRPVLGWRDHFQLQPQPYHAPLLVAAHAADQSLRIDDLTWWAPTEESQRAYGSLLDGSLPRSWLGAPVRSGSGETFGALLFCSGLVRAFDPDSERLAAGLAACLAAVIRTQRLSQEREAVTHALERTLLPPLLPVIDGMEVAARYRATGAGNLVGGDFYDVFPSRGGWDVLLGDVSGFGAEAAALTGIARYTVRAVAEQLDRPAAVLAALNDAMVGRVPDDRFCTAVFLRMRPEADRAVITVANGGHPPPLVLRDEGEVETFDAARGMLLGVTPSAQLTEAEVVLGPGDALVLYTDGVTEARDPKGEFFGIERLEDLLSTCAGRTADGVARRVELAVVDHQDGRTNDDVAVLVIRVAKAAT
jgi:serine phosphatase RsbU (regulator of sigma subunit)